MNEETGAFETAVPDSNGILLQPGDFHFVEIKGIQEAPNVRKTPQSFTSASLPVLGEGRRQAGHIRETSNTSQRWIGRAETTNCADSAK